MSQDSIVYFPASMVSLVSLLPIQSSLWVSLITNLIPGGGGVLPIMAYTGRLRPKGVPFSGFKYEKG